MNIINAGARGTITRGRDVWHIRNALVEEVSTNRAVGHMIVSYSVRSRNNLILVETLRLHINRNTIIGNQSGRPVCLCDIRPGIWIDVWFSPIETRWRIPPQATASRIVIRQRMHPAPPPIESIRTERVVSIDMVNRFLITGMRNDINRQMRFVVTNETIILNRNGGRIALHRIQIGQMVRVRHADFMTMSIPPQTTAFHIQVL